MHPDLVNLGRLALAAALGCALLDGPALADQREPVRRELRRRVLTIDDQALGSLPELQVAGGSATILTFEVPIREHGALIADTRGLFYPPTQTDKTLIVVPRADLAAPVALNVTLTDGTVLSFKLVSSAKATDVQVDVVLALQKRASPESAQALRTTIEQLRGELDECQSTSAAAGAAKLATLFVGQNLDEPQTFDSHALRGTEKQNRLLLEARWVYRLVGYTYLVFLLENRDAVRPWALDRAEVKLVGQGEALDLRVLATAGEAPLLAPGQGGKFVVAFRTPSQSGARRYTVTFVEKEGGRRVTLEGLTP